MRKKIERERGKKEKKKDRKKEGKKERKKERKRKKERERALHFFFFIRTSKFFLSLNVLNFRPI
jgi:cytoskeletal protein RodZ